MANTSKQAAKQAIITQKDFNLVLRVLKDNWWIPLIVVPCFYLLGIFYIYRLTSTYMVSTQILLENNDSYYKGNVVTDANFYGAQTYIDNSNEKRVLLSYDLLDKVINKLKDKLQISYYIVGKVRTTEQFGGMPFIVMVNNINPYFYERLFDFKILDEENFEITYTDGKEKISILGKFGKEIIDLGFNLNIIKSQALENVKITPLRDMYYQFQVHSNENLIGKILANISINNPDYTNVLEISMNDIIPERAVLILDSLNKEYLYSKLRSKYELNDKTIEYIDKQLDEIASQLKASVDTLQDYKRRKSIVNLGWEESDFLNKIGIYDRERSESQLHLQSLNDLEKYIIEDKDPQFLPPSVYVTDKDVFLKKATSELYEKQIELARLTNMLTDNNPGIQDKVTSVNKLKQDLLIYINNAKAASKSQIDNINNQISKYISEAKSIPPKQQDLLGFQRNLTVNEGIYNFLLEKKANTRIAKASIVPDAKVIETPRNVGEVSPDRAGIKKNFLTGGFAVALIVILLRTMFFTKIKDIDQLKELSDIPCLGMVPIMREAPTTGVIVDQDPNSQISESFRSIRTNLQYASVGNEHKTILITSFLPGEGKTFTSLNIAATIAKSGKKTLIIELDLHKPKVYKNLGISSPAVGITTYVSGHSNISDIVQKTEVQNLWCMFAGPIPPNPSDFVLSEKLHELIVYSRENFEHVIIDSPPAGLLSDSIYLMQYADASLFVLNPKTSSRKTIRFVHELKSSNNIKSLLFILNGVSNISKRYYYKGYGYSYGYGYGYGYGKGYGYRK